MLAAEKPLTPEMLAAPQAPAAPPRSTRLLSLDAYRGFVMLAMASGGLALARVARQHEGITLWSILGYQSEHVPWAGCAFWDLIQPSFMFIVGVAMPFSYARRLAEGSTPGKMFGHALWRSVLLVLLGIFLSSSGSRGTNYTFVNVLTQIGLGYSLVFLLLGKGLKVQLLSATGILVGYWLAFALYPLPPADFDRAAVAAAGAGETYSGFFAHWSKNQNLASAFDLWFLNLFPRSEPFRFNDGGYQTLNFIPSMATMIFGVMTGDLLRGSREMKGKLKVLIIAGVGCLLVGLLFWVTICPVVKRIWTPSWAVFSTGWTLLLLGAFYWAIDMRGWRGWAFPFVVVGMNSIAMYCMAQLLKPWITRTLKTHFGQGLFGGAYGPVLESLAFISCLWLVCFWMYRRKVFLRI